MDKVKRVIVALICGLVVTLMGVLVDCQAAAPAKPADFFKGKLIELVVYHEAGTTGDLAARVIALHMGKYLGATIVVINKPGGRYLEALNYTYHAKPDGLTWVTGLASGVAGHALDETPNFAAKTADGFASIGFLEDYFSYLVVLKDSPIKSFADLKASHGLKYGADSPTSGRTIRTAWCMKAADLDMKIVLGYSPVQCHLALMQREMDVNSGNCMNVTIWKTEGTIRPLVVQHYERSTSHPEVPAITEVAQISKEDLELLKFMRMALRPSKGFYVSAKVPKDGIAFLQEAFVTVCKTDGFVKDFNKVAGYEGWPVIHGKVYEEEAKQLELNKKRWKEEIVPMVKKYLVK